MRRVPLLAVFMMVGCSLNRWGIAALTTDGGVDSSIPMEDAAIDSSVADADVPDADLDASVDSGRDSGVDSGLDAGPDSGMLDAGTDDPCESYTGLCLRLTDTVDPDPIRSYWYTYVTAALTTVDPWASFTCVGGVVRSGNVSYCLVPNSERDSGRTMFFYASYNTDGTTTVCNPGGCPRADMEVWFDGMPFAAIEISQDRGDTRPPAAPCGGANFVFSISTP